VPQCRLPRSPTKKNENSTACSASTGARRYGAEKAEAYLAGCVLLGSALETLLILRINVFPEAEQTGEAPMRKGAHKYSVGSWLPDDVIYWKSQPR
jgi:hypothetical protein